MRGSAAIIQGLAPDGSIYPIEKLEAHRQGLHHVAVSVFVFAGDALLLQQRAGGKYHSGGQWANTCCSHPAWGEAVADCARRRLYEELGVDLELRPAGRIDYVAPVGGGLVENEAVHLFSAEVDRAGLVVDADATEVMATRWVAIDALKADIRRRPALYTPWLRIYLDRAGPLVERAA